MVTGHRAQPNRPRFILEWPLLYPFLPPPALFLLVPLPIRMGPFPHPSQPVSRVPLVYTPSSCKAQADPPGRAGPGVVSG